MTKPELAMWASDDGTGRAYKHPFREDSEGKPLQSPSVTTILKLKSKGDAIAQWAADQAVNWIAENQNMIYTMSEESIKQTGRFRWKSVRDERAEVGTGIHNTIEAEHTGSWNYPVLDEEQKQIMEQWALFNERFEVTSHRSEFTVWRPNEGVDYAGTADGLWDVTDRETGESWKNLYIDLKTSRNIWPEHWLQLAALFFAPYIMDKKEDGTWVETPARKSEGVAIVHLRADLWEFIPQTNFDILNNAYGQFMAYRSLWGLEREQAKLEKEIELAGRTTF